MLYREWFVHFRFPGHEHVKIIDGLPEGWERLSASDAFEVDLKTSGDDEGIITYVPMAALSEMGWLSIRRLFRNDKHQQACVSEMVTRSSLGLRHAWRMERRDLSSSLRMKRSHVDRPDSSFSVGDMSATSLFI